MNGAKGNVNLVEGMKVLASSKSNPRKDYHRSFVFGSGKSDGTEKMMLPTIKFGVNSDNKLCCCLPPDIGSDYPKIYVSACLMMEWIEMKYGPKPAVVVMEKNFVKLEFIFKEKVFSVMLLNDDEIFMFNDVQRKGKCLKTNMSEVEITYENIVETEDKESAMLQLISPFYNEFSELFE